VFKKIKKGISTVTSKTKKVSEEELFDFIQDRAFRLWDQAGRPQGKDWEFWFMAEKEIKDKLRKLGRL
jgi:hypothetical protein